MASSPDLLFGLRNNFFLGAYQAAINNSDVPNLSQEDAIERDSLVYRSYIALRSYQVSISSPIFSKHENPNKTHISNLLISSPFSSSASSVPFPLLLQLVINEIDSSAPTPLQAVKLLAIYLSGPENKVGIVR